MCLLRASRQLLRVPLLLSVYTEATLPDPLSFAPDISIYFHFHPSSHHYTFVSIFTNLLRSVCFQSMNAYYLSSKVLKLLTYLLAYIHKHQHSQTSTGLSALPSILDSILCATIPFSCIQKLDFQAFFFYV